MRTRNSHLSTTILLLLLLLLIFPSRLQSTCELYNRRYAHCSTLPVLDSYLHWTHHPSNNTVDIAFRHKGATPSDWVAWSLNPTGPHMVGSQCLIAFVNSTTGLPRPFTSPITGPSIQEGPLSFPVPRLSAEFRQSSSEMIIFATIELPNNRTNFTHVWQHGTVSRSGAFQAHPMTTAHMSSFATIDFATGASTNADTAAAARMLLLRRVHGIINVVSWGMMMPVGVIIARYVKFFAPTTPVWFYLHVSCQCLGFLLGLFGVGLGFSLPRHHGGHPAHMYMGIAILVGATLQVFALFLRPKPDHKYRKYWNVYHRTIGYGTIVLGSVNIYFGIDILLPGKVWKHAYTAWVATLVGAFIFLEAWSWVVVINRKKRKQQETTASPNLGEDAA